MAIQTQCPTCETPYTLAETQRGKRVRCRHCADAFVVGGPAAAEDVALVEPLDEEEEDRVQAEPRRGPAARRAPRLRDDEEDYDRPRRRGDRDEEDSSSAMTWWLVGGGAALLVLLIGGGVLTFALMSSKADDQTADSNSADKDKVAVQQPPANNPVANNPIPFPNPNPVPVVQPAPEVPAVNAFTEPRDLDEAVAILKDPTSDRRRTAADWLGRQPLNEQRRAEVAGALESVVDDGNLADPAARALARWATKDSVPALIKVAESPSGIAWMQAMEVLGKLKDERAAAPLARQLQNGGRRLWAQNALKALGPVAEKEVLPHLHAKDIGLRLAAADLLRGYKTSPETLLDQTLTDLESTEAQVRQAAADDLAKRRLDPNKQSQVAQALNHLLTDTDQFTRDTALRALKVWAAKVNVPALIELAKNDPGRKGRALDLLIQLKDERAAELLAASLDGVDRLRAGKALEEMGPAAEKAVAPYLFHQNLLVRKEAIRILSAVGTRASIPYLQQLGLRDRMTLRDVQLAIKTIAARSKQKAGN